MDNCEKNSNSGHELILDIPVIFVTIQSLVHCLVYSEVFVIHISLYSSHVYNEFGV